MCEGQGIAFSGAHRHLEAHNDQGRDLPCPDHGAHVDECDAIAQWDVYRNGPTECEYWPLVIGTHNFAHVPGLRTGTNLVLDKESDFDHYFSTERVREAVGAFLRGSMRP